MRLALALAATSLLSICGAPAQAASSDACLLQVEGKTYIKGRCLISIDPDGGLSVGTDGDRIGSPYFAIVTPNKDGTATAAWSAVPRSTHAQTPLGVLQREGSCWVNATAKICAK